jgi:hypothetical protein
MDANENRKKRKIIDDDWTRGPYTNYNHVNRLKIVENLEKGVEPSFNIPRQTLDYWKETKEELRLDSIGLGKPKKKQRRKGGGRKPVVSFEKEEELAEWIRFMRRAPRFAPITIRLAIAKALQLFSEPAGEVKDLNIEENEENEEINEELFGNIIKDEEGENIGNNNNNNIAIVVEAPVPAPPTPPKPRSFKSTIKLNGPFVLKKRGRPKGSKKTKKQPNIINTNTTATNTTKSVETGNQTADTDVDESNETNTNISSAPPIIINNNTLTNAVSTNTNEPNNNESSEINTNKKKNFLRENG